MCGIVIDDHRTRRGEDIPVGTGGGLQPMENGASFIISYGIVFRDRAAIKTLHHAQVSATAFGVEPEVALSR